MQAEREREGADRKRDSQTDRQADRYSARRRDREKAIQPERERDFKMYNVYLQDLHNINMKPKVQKVCCAINRYLHAHFFFPLFPFLTNFITDSFLF